MSSTTSATSTISTSPRTLPPTTALTTAPSPTRQLPGDLTPNVVEDECLLTAAELGILISRSPVRAENTEQAGGGARRSCFYTLDAADEPAARIDVYSSASLPPPELLARIAANGGRPLPDGQGAVVVTGREGVAELVVASPILLAVLTILPGGAATQPSDQAWTAAGTAMASRLPAQR